jgi:hypothetical protein
VELAPGHQRVVVAMGGPYMDTDGGRHAAVAPAQHGPGTVSRAGSATPSERSQRGSRKHQHQHQHQHQHGHGQQGARGMTTRSPGSSRGGSPAHSVSGSSHSHSHSSHRGSGQGYVAPVSRFPPPMLHSQGQGQGQGHHGHGGRHGRGQSASSSPALSASSDHYGGGPRMRL